MMAQSNPHSTAQARANGVVSNMPEFQKAFGCKKGQPMVRENACRVLVEVRRDQLLPSLNISEGRGSWQPPTPAPRRELPATKYRSQSSQMRGPGSPGQWLL